jgi:hypothetical protein
MGRTISMLALVALCGCRFETDACQLTTLDVSTNLVVVSTSSQVAGCQWPQSPLPLAYRLAGPTYVVSITVFANNSGGLGLSAQDLDGRPLRLQGVAFMDAKDVKVPVERTGFRYWVLPAWIDNAPVRFSVLGDRGEVLGSHVLRYQVLRGKRTVLRPLLGA